MNKFLIGCLLFASWGAASKTLWSNYSVSYLKGADYEVGDPDRQILTLEYASGTSWGDHFMFIDRAEPSAGDPSTYVELSPRIRVSDFSVGILNNLYITPGAEFGPQNNWMFGLGTDLTLPNFRYAKLSYYLKNNGDGDNNQQITFTWALPFGDNWLYDGFIDVMTAYDKDNGFKSQDQINFTSQLKYNIKPLLNLTSDLYLGIEYVYWTNKFGIDGIDEQNANLLIKYHF